MKNSENISNVKNPISKANNTVMGLSPKQALKKKALEYLIAWCMFYFILLLLGKDALLFGTMFFAFPGIPLTLIVLFARFIKSIFSEKTFNFIDKNISENNILPTYIGKTDQWLYPIVVDETNKKLLIGTDFFNFSDVKSIHIKKTTSGIDRNSKIEVILKKGENPIRVISDDNRDAFFHRLSNTLGFN